MNNGCRWNAVIFDFDGVIVDSEPIHYRAFQETLAPLEIRHSYDRYVAHYIGFDDRESFRRIFRDAGCRVDPERIPRLMEAKFQAFKRIVGLGVRTFPGVRTLIESVAARDIPLAIASGSSLREIELMLAALNLRHHFRTIITADQVFRSKPDPATYLLALGELRAGCPLKDWHPRTCLGIEDTPTGIEAAKQAGLSVLGVAHTYPSGRLTGADFRAETLEFLDIQNLSPILP